MLDIDEELVILAEGSKEEEFEVAFKFCAPWASTAEAFAVRLDGDVRLPEERGDEELADAVALDAAADEFWEAAVPFARRDELADPLASVTDILPAVLLGDVKFPFKPPRAEDEEFKVAFDSKAVAF